MILIAMILMILMILIAMILMILMKSWKSILMIILRKILNLLFSHAVSLRLLIVQCWREERKNLKMKNAFSWRKMMFKVRSTWVLSCC